MKDLEKIRRTGSIMELLMYILFIVLYNVKLIDGYVSILGLIALSVIVVINAMYNMFQTIHCTVALSSFINTISTKEIMNGSLDKMSEEEMYSTLISRIADIQENRNSKK